MPHRDRLLRIFLTVGFSGAAASACIMGGQVRPQQPPVEVVDPIEGVINPRLAPHRAEAMRAVNAFVHDTEIDSEQLMRHWIDRDVDGIEVEAEPGRRVDRNIAVENLPQGLPVGRFFDMASFGLDVYETLADQCVGYLLLIGRNGQIQHKGHVNWARVPGDASVVAGDDSATWEDDLYMNIASVSKLFTAMAMLKAIDDNPAVQPSSSIAPWLPAYWQLGPNVQQITFTNLMQNNANLQSGGAMDYISMRQEIQDGLAAGMVGGGSYDNINFALQRILIATVSGRVDRQALIDSAPGMLSGNGTWHDTWWDAVTTSAYKSYMGENVFQPAGVYTATLTTLNHPIYSRAYDWPVQLPGWSSGTKESSAGSSGWVLTGEQALKTLAAIRDGKILPSARADWALQMGLGVDVIRNTALGPVYAKNGRWTNGNGQTEQSTALILPGDLELIIYVNSWIGPDGARVFLRTLMLDLYEANIK